MRLQINVKLFLNDLEELELTGVEVESLVLSFTQTEGNSLLLLTVHENTAETVFLVVTVEMIVLVVLS